MILNIGPDRIVGYKFFKKVKLHYASKIIHQCPATDDKVIERAEDLALPLLQELFPFNRCLSFAGITFCLNLTAEISFLIACSEYLYYVTLPTYLLLRYSFSIEKQNNIGRKMTRETKEFRL